MKLTLKSREIALLAVCSGLLLMALLGPSVSQPANYHQFADQHPWFGIPFAMDVLTNLPFALWGVMGLLRLHQQQPERLEASQRATVTLFFTGMVLTAMCSGWYHWAPGDAGLAVDRLGMVVAFAGLIGLAAAGRISARSGLTITCAVLLLGPLSVASWAVTGNVLPWVVLQFGGMALVLWMASIPRLAGALPIRWGVVIGIYALAKLLEQGDHQVYALLGNTISGHSLKHVVASLAAWPVLSALSDCSGPASVGTRQKAGSGDEVLTPPCRAAAPLINDEAAS
jgi:hypothetical protein